MQETSHMLHFSKLHWSYNYICQYLLPTYLPIYVYIFFFFGVHPLRITTTSSSKLRVGITVAEEANAWEALSDTNWVGIMIRIRNWTEHWSMLISATASESCSSIVFSVKEWHSKATGRSPGSSVGFESLQPTKIMLHFLRIDLMWSFLRFFCPPTLLWPSLSWPWSTPWGSLLWGILISWPNQRSWRIMSMVSIDGITDDADVSQQQGWIRQHHRCTEWHKSLQKKS